MLVTKVWLLLLPHDELEKEEIRLASRKWIALCFHEKLVEFRSINAYPLGINTN